MSGCGLSFILLSVVASFAWISLHCSASSMLLRGNDGKIHADIDSVYRLKDPRDIFDLYDQEKLHGAVGAFEKSLETLRSELDELLSQDDGDVDVEKLILQTSVDCKRAGDLYKKLNLFESVVLSLEEKGFRTEDFISTKSVRNPFKSPECTSIDADAASTAIFKIFKGFQKRRSLKTAPEVSITNQVTNGLTVSEFGHAVAEGLSMNATSWILYNMAAFYYRITGEALQGMECAKRALDYSSESSRSHRDVALMNIASLLYRGDFPHDAIAATTLALESSGTSASVHMLRGFIFASVSRFEKSVDAFENAAKFAPGQRSRMEKHAYAIRCHAKVHQALSEQHEKLRRVIRKFELINGVTSNLDSVTRRLLQLKRSDNGFLLNAYGFRETWRYPREFAFTEDGFYGIGRNPLAPHPVTVWRQKISLKEPSGWPQKYSSLAVPDIKIPLTDWPTPESCQEHARKDQLSTLRPRRVIILPEHRGFQFWELIRPLFSGPGSSLPFCENEKLPLPRIMQDSLAKAVADHPNAGADSDMTHVIESYMNQCGVLEEFGRKLALAHSLGILPSWLYFNMAAVFWRSYGSNSRAAACLVRAYYLTPSSYRDMVLINLSTFFSFHNETDLALTTSREAGETTLSSASFHAMGTVLSSHGFLGIAAKNYRLALMQDLSFYPAMDALRSSECTRMLAENSSSQSEKDLSESIIEISIVDSKSTTVRMMRSTSSLTTSAKESLKKFEAPVRVSIKSKNKT